MKNTLIYQKSNLDFWQGRDVNPALENQYWYQAIKLVDIENEDLPLEKTKDTKVALIGYAVEEGVRRNQGRIGAAEGPNAIRAKLAKIALHNNAHLYDCGNIICLKGNLETSQNKQADVVSKLLNQGVFPIALGGGHDIAFANFKGIWESDILKSNKKIGIINFDAHLDLRPVVNKPNSGTPFYQIFKDYNANNQIHYCILGLQKQSNTKELLDIAASNNVLIIESEECESHKADLIIEHLQDFIDKVSHLYITIDMDVFSSAYVSGVSAPSPLGIQPNFIFPVLKFLLTSKKVVMCDIAELNPKYDNQGLSANLAGRLVDYIVTSLNQ